MDCTNHHDTLCMDLWREKGDDVGNYTETLLYSLGWCFSLAATATLLVMIWIKSSLYGGGGGKLQSCSGVGMRWHNIQRADAFDATTTTTTSHCQNQLHMRTSAFSRISIQGCTASNFSFVPSSFLPTFILCNVQFLLLYSMPRSKTHSIFVPSSPPFFRLNIGSPLWY